MQITNDYMVLLGNIIKEQDLNCKVKDLPVIINCSDTMYIGAYIFSENEEHLSIVVPNDDGQEFAKILNKKYIISIEILYEEMLEEVETEKELKGYD